MLNYSLIDFIYILPAIIYGFTIHELSHAFAAVKLGDNTPRELGRYTLNPLSHIDPIGLIMVLFAGIGWAKPVTYQPARLRNPKTDPVLVALAGPLSNLLSAVLFTLIFKILFTLGVRGSSSISILGFLQYLIYVNMMLAVFNLLPFPPLDGSHILLHLLPDSLNNFKRRYLQYGYFIFLAVILLNIIMNLNLFSGLIIRATNGLLKVFGLL